MLSNVPVLILSVQGRLDGSVFLAHTRFGSDTSVSGCRLEWGNTGTRGIGVGSTSSTIDGDFGVGAVSCLAAARGAGYRQGRADENRIGTVETDDQEMLAALSLCLVMEDDDNDDGDRAVVMAENPQGAMSRRGS